VPTLQLETNTILTWRGQKIVEVELSVDVFIS